MGTENTFYCGKISEYLASFYPLSSFFCGTLPSCLQPPEAHPSPRVPFCILPFLCYCPSLLLLPLSFCCLSFLIPPNSSPVSLPVKITKKWQGERRIDVLYEYVPHNLSQLARDGRNENKEGKRNKRHKFPSRVTQKPPCLALPTGADALSRANNHSKGISPHFSTLFSLSFFILHSKDQGLRGGGKERAHLLLQVAFAVGQEKSCFGGRKKR